MHDEILSASQRELLPLMKQFKREYYLVGGTAIALHIGHRRSVDFDMFKEAAINHKKNLEKISAGGFTHQVTRRVYEQMNLLVNGVKLTFFQTCPNFCRQHITAIARDNNNPPSLPLSAEICITNAEC